MVTEANKKKMDAVLKDAMQVSGDDKALQSESGLATLAWYSIIALGAYVVISAMLPFRYGMQYWFSFSEPEVNERLWAEYESEIKQAGITSISAIKPYQFLLISGPSKAHVEIKKNGESYTAQVNYSRPDYMANAWIDVSNTSLRYMGLKKNTHGNYSDYDFHYEIATDLLDASIKAARVAEENRLKWGLSESAAKTVGD